MIRMNAFEYGAELGPEKSHDSWEDLAEYLGADPDMFFPTRGESSKPAKEVCKQCVVREACLDYALAIGEKHGVWGGLSERERRRIRRQRRMPIIEQPTDTTPEE